MIVGYMRVSSIDQNLDRQLDSVELDRVYEEKISGKDRDRPQLKECLNFLREGDVLYVHSMDRLSRNLKDLLNIVSELISKNVTVKTKKVRFCKKCRDNIYMNNFYYPQKGGKAICLSCGYDKYHETGFISWLLRKLNF